MQSCWAQETFVKNLIKPKCKHHSLTEHLMVCAKGGGGDYMHLVCLKVNNNLRWSGNAHDVAKKQKISSVIVYVHYCTLLVNKYNLSQMLYNSDYNLQHACLYRNKIPHSWRNTRRRQQCKLSGCADAPFNVLYLWPWSFTFCFS